MPDLNDYYYHSQYQVASAPAPTFQEVVLATNPSGFWRLGEASGNAADLSGNGLTLTASGSITYGVSGWASDGSKAMTFAANSLLERADNNLFDVGTGDYSAMFVIGGFSWGTQQIVGHDGAGNNGEFDIHLTGTSDLIRVTHRDITVGTGINHDFTTAVDALDTNGLHLCHMTFDRDSATGGKLYVDGSLASTVDISSSSASDLTNTRPFRAGAANSSGVTQYVGTMAEVALWKGVVLSSTDVSNMYGAR